MSTAQKADHILEMPGLGAFWDYCFKNHTSKSRYSFV